ncbi:MAG: zinc-binding dehydrogenase, partial [Haliea sp.]
LVGFGALQVTTGEESVAGLLWGFAKLLGLWRCLPDGRQTGFYNIQSRREKHPQEFRDDVMTLMQWLKEGRLHPAVAEVRPLAEAAEVHRLIDAGAVPGKIVLDCQA